MTPESELPTHVGCSPGWPMTFRRGSQLRGAGTKTELRKVKFAWISPYPGNGFGAWNVSGGSALGTTTTPCSVTVKPRWRSKSRS